MGNERTQIQFSAMSHWSNGSTDGDICESTWHGAGQVAGLNDGIVPKLLNWLCLDVGNLESSNRME